MNLLLPDQDDNGNIGHNQISLKFTNFTPPKSAAKQSSVSIRRQSSVIPGWTPISVVTSMRLTIHQHPLLDELRRIADDDGPWFDIFCHDRSGTDDRPLANRDAWEND